MPKTAAVDASCAVGCVSAMGAAGVMTGLGDRERRADLLLALLLDLLRNPPPAASSAPSCM